MELTASMRRFLEEGPRFGVAGTVNRDGSPQLSAMWYELQGDEIMMNSMVGRTKERNLKRDPRCSLCVVDGYYYVTLHGTATLNYDPVQAQADIARLARRYRGEAAEAGIARFALEERVTIRLRVERIWSMGF